MSEVNTGRCASDGVHSESGDAALMSAAKWLSLAATPVLALMALLTATEHGGPAGHGSTPLSGMTLMYALMAVFHAVPWLRLVSRLGR